MAVTCDRCGRAVTEKPVIVQSLDHRERFEFEYHPYCAGEMFKQLEAQSLWAHGDPASHAADGLEWELVERSYSYQRRTVLQPRYANRILTLCRERGITRDQLAEELGTSRGAVGRWLTSYADHYGHPRGLTVEWAQRLVVFFDLDSRADLFERAPHGDAPAEEFEEVS